MAARGFDQLIDFLLEEITLCGTNGADSTDFKRFVNKFYSPKDDGSTDELELVPNSRPKALVDEKFYEKVWKWLIAHPGAHLGNEEERRHISLAALVEWEMNGKAPPEEPRKDKRKAKVAAGDAVPTAANTDSAAQAPRIHVSGDRIWKALTGHAKDLKRVPPFEFELLSYIAFAGPEGIIQPFLIERSGQDKRSVPKRTDNLHAKGYIEKRGILSSERSLRTSLLVLRKFTRQDQTKKRTSYRGSTRVFEHGSLDYDRFLNYMMEAFGKNKDVIAISDLYRDLEVYGNESKWQRGAVFRAMKRMCEIGIAEKLKARDQYNANRFHRSIRLLRQPTGRDREAFSTFVNRSYFGNPSQVEGGEEDDIDADADAAAEDDQDSLLGENMLDGLRPPSWNPSLPVSNQLYDAIASAGTAGMTSQVAQKTIFGKFWKRPMETILVNLTNDWQGSQPMHLRHLAIIRDTEQNEFKKGSHYLYRTFDNFASLVESGEFSWDAVSRPVSKKEKKTKKSQEQSTVDKWGFPTLNSKRFVKGSGTATFRQAYDLIKQPVKNETGKSRELMDLDAARPIGAPRLGRPPKSNQTHKEQDTEKKVRKLMELVSRQARKLVEHETWKEYRADPTLVPDLSALASDSKVAGSSRERKLDAAENEQPASRKRQARGQNSSPQEPSDSIANQTSNGGYHSSATTQMPDVIGLSVPGAQISAIETSSQAQSEHPGTTSNRDDEVSTHSAQMPPDASDSILRDARDSLPSVPSLKGAKGRSKPLTMDQKKKLVYKALGSDERVVEAVERILLKTKPAVYIDSIGSQKPAKHGRPRKATIAVFKTSQLAEFEWFKRESDQHEPKEQDRRRYEEIRDEALQRLTGKKVGKRHTTVVETPAESSDEEMSPEEQTVDPVQTVESITPAQARPEEKEKVYRSPYPNVDRSIAQSSSASTPQRDVSLPTATPPPDPHKGTRVSSVANNEGKSKNSPRRTTRVVKLGQGSVSSKRTQIIMEIVRMGGGLYPTGGPMQPVYKSLWREKNPNQTSTTDNKTIADTVKGLVHNAKLVRLVFSFRKNGTTSHRGIVALPGFQPDSPEVRQLQLKIIETYPDSYFPPEVRHLVPASYLSNSRRGARIEQLAVNRDVVVQRKHLFRKEIMEQDRLLNRTQERVNKTAQKKAQKKAEALQAKQARIDERQRDLETLRKRQSRALHAETTTRSSMSRPQRTSYALQVTLGPDMASMRAGLADVYTLPINQNEDELRRLEQGLEEEDSDEDTPILFNPSRTGSTRNTVPLHGGSIRFHSKLGELPVRQTQLPFVYRSRMCNFTDYVPQSDMDAPLVFPHVQFHSASGTFGTVYGPSLYIYDLRYLKDEASHSLWEAKMPNDLEDLLTRVSHYRIRDMHKDKDPRRAKFFQAIDRISHGEVKDVERGTYVVYTPEGVAPHNPHTPRLRIPRFINHTLPGKQTLAPYAGPLVVEDGPNNDAPTGEKFTFLWDHERSWVCTYPEMPPTEPEWETRAVRESWERLRKRPRLETDSHERLRRPKKWANLVEALTREKGPPPKPKKRSGKDPGKRKRFGPRNNDFTIDATAMKRLLYAAVVVKVLAGGNRSTISWNLMHYIFRHHPNLDLMTLKNRLTWIDSHYNDMYQKLQDSFRDAFILAYERGELPQLDYGDLENYDWDYVVEWAQTNLLLPSEAGTKLPADRADLEKLYNLNEMPAGYLGRQKARYFRPEEMMKNRRQAAHSLPFAAPVYPVNHASIQHNNRRHADIALGKSWLRANATTPAADYDKNAAMLKLGELDHSLLSNSVNMLIRDKVFVHRTKGKTLIPGRNYQFTHLFEKSIRSDIRADNLSGAVRYKQAMDEAFGYTERVRIDPEGDVVMEASKEASVDIPITVSTSAVLVNFNLLATHRIRLRAHIPPVSTCLPFDRPPGPVVSKWGFARGHYSTRRMPREAFHWPISAVPTAAYMPGIMPVAPPPTSADSIAVTPVSVLNARSPALRGQPLIPLWRTLHDGVILHWWGRFVACVLHVLATRTGLTTQRIVGLLNGYIDITEVKMVIGWLENVGAVRRLYNTQNTLTREVQAKGPWILQDGWWSILGDDQAGDFASGGAAWTRDRITDEPQSSNGSRAEEDDLRRSRLGMRFIPKGTEDMAIGMGR